MSNNRVHIIGGGINGLCSAWYLIKKGYHVTIIDGTDLSDGTSHGNAGMIVPSHFVPMPTPGVIKQGIKFLLDSKSPFYIRPRASWDLLQWIWGFLRSATPQKIKTGSKVLLDLNQESRDLYRKMALELPETFHFEDKGLLMLFNTLAQEKEEKELADMAHDLGIEARMVDPLQLQKMEPTTLPTARGALYFPGDAHLHPGQLMKILHSQLKKLGVEFLLGSNVLDFKMKGARINEIVTQNHSIPANEIVLTSGIWSKQLAKKAGVHLVLQDGKGYSFTVPNGPIGLQIPTILSEAKVAITPMGKELRIGGTLEISGITQGVNKKRVSGIIGSIDKYYKRLPIAPDVKKSVWVGYRPLSFDGLPYVGKPKNVPNLTIATGHGMMGLSLGPITGKLVSDIIAENKIPFDLHPLRIDR
jgi:D-amino-acid dehydrogenase